MKSSDMLGPVTVPCTVNAALDAGLELGRRGSEVGEVVPEDVELGAAPPPSTVLVVFPAGLAESPFDAALLSL